METITEIPEAKIPTFYYEKVKTTVKKTCKECGAPFLVSYDSTCDPKILDPRLNPFIDLCDDCIMKKPGPRFTNERTLQQIYCDDEKPVSEQENEANGE